VFALVVVTAIPLSEGASVTQRSLCDRQKYTVYVLPSRHSRKNVRSGMSENRVPITEGIAVYGCHIFFLAPGPLQEITIEEEAMHINTTVAAPMLMYCEREILEVRRNGLVIPWELDERRHLLSIDARAALSEEETMYTVTFS